MVFENDSDIFIEIAHEQLNFDEIVSWIRHMLSTDK